MLKWKDKGEHLNRSKERGNAHTCRKGKHTSYSGRMDRNPFQLFGSATKKRSWGVGHPILTLVSFFPICECKLIGPGCLFTRTLFFNLKWQRYCLTCWLGIFPHLYCIFQILQRESDVCYSLFPNLVCSFFNSFPPGFWKTFVLW